MKKLLVSLLLAVMAGAAAGQTGPSETALVREHDGWWNAPERPAVHAVVRNPSKRTRSGNLRLLVTPDIPGRCPTIEQTFEYRVAAGDSVVVAFAPLEVDPGFYRCTIVRDGVRVDSMNIGYEPLNIVSLPDSQPDFREFWEETLAELAAVDPQYTMTEVPEWSGTKRKVYLVQMRSLGNELIQGYLTMPIAKGVYPVSLYFNGYGNKPWHVAADGNPDWIEFVLFERGQALNAENNRYGDWFYYGMGDRMEYYYRGAFMDCVRAIDFVWQLPQTDRSNIFAEGGSQGGAYTLAAAALDGRLTAIAPSIPFLSDFPDYAQIAEWPVNPALRTADAKGVSREAIFEMLSYFDIKNLARWIKCPVLMGVGLQDRVCPPHTNFSGFNLIEAPKHFIIYQNEGHRVPPAEWHPVKRQFFEKNRK